MTQARASSFGTTPEEDVKLDAAQSLHARLDKANLHILRHIAEFNSCRFDLDEAEDTENIEPRDPAIVAADVGAQLSFLRKLKFQYLEQNAKDKYVKSIVSDIDDAPIVTAEDNKELLASNIRKKGELNVAKANLAEIRHNIRTLAPLVEQDYKKAKQATDQATLLAQKIIDARLALTRLRKTHPQPRLTIPLADQKLMDQVTEMQNLNDEVQSINKQMHVIKEQVKMGSLEVERLRVERAEVEKAVKVARVDEDDGRLIPLYDWYTASTTLYRSINDLLESHAASDNELRLTYRISSRDSTSHQITITLIFVPDTRKLAAVQTFGLDELGVNMGDVIDAHIQVNDVHGVVAAILARARNVGI